MTVRNFACLLLGSNQVTFVWRNGESFAEVSRSYSSPSEIGLTLNELFNEAPLSERMFRIVIAIDTDAVYPVELANSASLSVDRRALTYAAERFLPMDAEEIETAIMHRTDKTLRLVVCRRQPVIECIDFLNQKGQRIEAVMPATLLVVRHWLDEKKLAKDCRAQLKRGSQTEFIGIVNDSPSLWIAGVVDEASLAQRLAVHEFPDLSANSISHVVCETAELLPESGIHLTDKGQVIMAGRWENCLLEATRHFLESRPRLDCAFRLSSFQAGAATDPDSSLAYRAALLGLLVLATLAISFWIRSVRIDAAIATVESEKIRMCAEVLEERPERIRAPERMLEATWESVRSETDLAYLDSAPAESLGFLLSILRQIPDGSGIEFGRLEFQKSSASIKGSATTLAQVDNLTKKLRHAEFAVEQVRYALDFELLVRGEATGKIEARIGDPAFLDALMAIATRQPGEAKRK